jgi:crossover junction endodeoxyribonuclease RusA
MTAGLYAAARCTLVLPYKTPPKGLYANVRTHWRRRSADTLQVRADVTNLAKAAHLHRVDGVRFVTVELVWAPGDRRRRDADNLWPLLKVICDALARQRADLVGLDLVPDDTAEFMQKLAPRIEPPPAKPGMFVHIGLYCEDAT